LYFPAIENQPAEVRPARRDSIYAGTNSFAKSGFSNSPSGVEEEVGENISIVFDYLFPVFATAGCPSV
jgi:hypothetical protein